MPRSDDYDTSHIPDYPSWYMVFPSLLFVDGLGLVSAAAYAVAEDKDQSTRHLATVGLVLASHAIIFSCYHMIAEGSARSYNYYAILIPDSILCVGFTASWITVVAAGFNGKSEMEIVLLVFCVFGSVISLVSVVLWGIAVFKHRRAGGISTYAGSESGVPDYPGSSEEGTGSGNRTASDNTNMEQINGDGTASGNVSREQMNGSWNTSDNANSAMDGNTSDDVNMDPGDGNRNTSNNVTSHNRKSIHYVPDHPYHPLRMHPIDGNRNTSQDQTSVHYVAAHPHHPLRMHPVDSTSTIRSVAPDVIQNSKKTIEKAEQVPASPNSAAPLVSPPLPPTACTCEHIHIS